MTTLASAWPDAAALNAFVASKLPPWLAAASPEHQVAYRKSSRNEALAAGELAGLTAELQSPIDFARPLLVEALKLRFGVTLDVDAHELVRLSDLTSASVVGDLLSPSRRRAVHRQSLLECALSNFSAQESVEGGLGAECVILPRDELRVTLGEVRNQHQLPPLVWRYHASRVIAIKPHQFAQLCRDLDLGQQYQAHFQAVYRPVAVDPQYQPGPGTDAQIPRAILQRYACSLETEARSAHLRGHIDDDQLHVLLKVASVAHAPTWLGQPVICQQLRVLQTRTHDGYLLTGAMVFKTAGSPACIVYLPGDPQSPIKAYADLDTFAAQLREHLRQDAYRRYFFRFINHAASPEFSRRLLDTLSPRPLFDADRGERVADPDADIGLVAMDQILPAPLLHYFQLLTRISYDASVIAVPTADVDTAARQARLLHYLGLGLDVAGVAGFFIPAVGLLVAVGGIGQLLREIYVGVDDWQHGQMAEAHAHLFNVMENVALVAGGGVASEIASSEFLSKMTPVLDLEGRQRLLSTDLERFRVPFELPLELRPNALGQYSLDGALYVRIDGHLFEQRFNASGQQWEIVPGPLAPPCAPRLHHNGAGAWRHAHERPLQWSAEHMMRRWGPASEGLDDQQRARALVTSGCTEERLRFVQERRLPMPGILADALQREQLLQNLEALASAVRSGDMTDARSAVLASELIKLPRWPANVALEVSGAGETRVLSPVEEIPDTRIALTEQQIDAGEWAQEVVAQLGPVKAHELFGDSVASDPLLRAQTLRDQLATQITENKKALFLADYQHAQGPAAEVVERLQLKFPALPQPVACEVIERATGAERREWLDTEQVPLRIAEEANVSQRQVRLARAYEGLVHDALANDDRDSLVFGLLDQLPGWSAQVGLELRAESVTGKVLASTASAQATEFKYLVRTAKGYVPYDADHEALGGPGSIFEALLRALPDGERQALSLELTDGARLRQALHELATADRSRAARLIGARSSHPLFAAPRRAIYQVGYMRQALGLPATPLQRLRVLYPTLGDVQLSNLANQLQHGGVALADAVLRLETEWRVLDQSLADWTALDIVDEQVGPMRAMVAQRIRHAWRREIPGTDSQVLALDLEGLSVDSLPTLTANFDHVSEAWLADMDLPSIPDDFLARFPNLLRLDLSGNELTAIPAQVGNMSRLRRLQLDDNNLSANDPQLLAPLRGLNHLITLTLEANALELSAPLFADFAQLPSLRVLRLAGNRFAPTAEEFQSLAAMPQLQVLNLDDNLVALDAARVDALRGLTQLRVLRLSHNPLTMAPDVTGMSHLEVLELNNAGIDQWPTGLTALMDGTQPGIREIYLEGNAIVDVPPIANTYFIANRERAMPDTFRLVVQGNPFSAQSVENLRAARIPVGEPPLVVPAPGHWLEGCPPALRERIEQVAQQPGREVFYEVMWRVTGTRIYEIAAAQVRQRLWALAETVLSPEAQAETFGIASLRTQLEEVAQEALGTCEDGVALVLNRLEVMVLAWRAATTAVGEGEAIFEPLIRLSDRLLRMDLVDDRAMRITRLRAARLAQRDAGTPVAQLPALDLLDDISEANLAGGVDEVEVRLYALGQLREVLDLPLPATPMRYGTILSTHTLDGLQRETLAQATTARLTDWLVDRPTWTPYLERFYAPRFDALAQFWDRSMDLFETLTDLDEPIDPGATLPAEVLAVLESAAPEVAWVHEGRLQHVNLNSQQSMTVYDGLRAARERQTRALRASLSAALIERFSQLPR